MAIIMIDYENRGIEALRGIHHLNSEDALYIFYSDCCRKIHAEYMKSIVDTGCDFHICKLKNTGKNALDFYIATELGAIFGGGYEGEIAIISNDKGYRAVIDFWKQNGDKKRNVVLAPDIQTGLSLMNMPQDKDRRIWLQNCMKPLDLGEEYAKYKQRKDFRNKLEAGWFNNLRKFRNDRFEETDNMGRRKKRYLSLPLFTYLTFDNLNNISRKMDIKQFLSECLVDKYMVED